MHKFSENVKYTVGYMSLSTATSATCSTGTGVDMAKYNNFCGLIGYVCASATGDVIAYVRESTDGTTWAATYLSTTTIASCITPIVGAFGSVEIRAEQMSDNYRYLRVEVIPAAASGIFAIANLRFNSRFPQATLPA